MSTNNVKRVVGAALLSGGVAVAGLAAAASANAYPTYPTKGCTCSGCDRDLVPPQADLPALDATPTPPQTTPLAAPANAAALGLAELFKICMP
jgi:hypothetical protein